MDDVKKQVSPVATSQDVTSGEVTALATGELETLTFDGVDPIFDAQARLINHSVQCIGMGKVCRLVC
jgi:hypothetical protein